VRAALRLVAALLAGISAPLAAQDNGAAPDPAAAGTAAQPALPAPGPIHQVAASETVWARGLMASDPGAVVCLEEGEEMLFASDRVTFQILGEGCFKLGMAEEDAFADEQRALHTHLIGQAEAEHQVAAASGDKAATDLAHARLQEALRQGAEHGVHPATPAAASTRRAATATLMRSAPGRVRTGAVRGDPPAVPASRPVIFRLASATPGVLKRYPRGTLVQRTTALCLNRGEEATIVGSNGQSANYSGSGCLHRKAGRAGWFDPAQPFIDRPVYNV
jgi:hypothetical protein